MSHKFCISLTLFWHSRSPLPNGWKTCPCLRVVFYCVHLDECVCTWIRRVTMEGFLKAVKKQLQAHLATPIMYVGHEYGLLSWNVPILWGHIFSSWKEKRNFTKRFQEKMKVNMTLVEGKEEKVHHNSHKKFRKQKYGEARRRRFSLENFKPNYKFMLLQMCLRAFYALTSSPSRSTWKETLLDSGGNHMMMFTSLESFHSLFFCQILAKFHARNFSLPFNIAPEMERIPLKLSSGTSLKVFLLKIFFSSSHSRFRMETSRDFLCCAWIVLLLHIASECCWGEINWVNARLCRCCCCKASKLLWSFFSICRNDSLLTAICRREAPTQEASLLNRRRLRQLRFLNLIQIFRLCSDSFDLIEFSEGAMRKPFTCK